MYSKSKIQLSLLRWILSVIVFSFNIGFVRSEIAHRNITNATCRTTTYLKEQMFQCELTLHAEDPSQRLILNFNQLELNCSDTLYIYEGSTVAGDPAFKLTCENETGTVIYSTTNSLTLEYVTADTLGFNSNDFLLAYAPFNDSRNGCDGFVCKDDGMYCISREFLCDAYYHCSDGSDEGQSCMLHDDSYDQFKLIALVCFASFILFLGIIWLCVHTRKVMRNRAVINRNGVINN